MSETADGLQMCIDKLYNYCTKWGLQINMKKTKSVVFKIIQENSTIKYLMYIMYLLKEQKGINIWEYI